MYWQVATWRLTSVNIHYVDVEIQLLYVEVQTQFIIARQYIYIIKMKYQS